MFCIVYVSETELYTVHCTNITTNQENHSSTGIIRIDSKMIVDVVTSVFMLLVSGCCVLAIRRVGKKKDYLEPMYSKDTESLIDVILLESMYQGQHALLSHHLFNPKINFQQVLWSKFGILSSNLQNTIRNGL